jgi:hypothetical protein
MSFTRTRADPPLVGEARPGAAAAGVLLYPLRVAVDGAVGVQPVVSLVCGSENR